jgi:hypothetical protein
MGMVKKKQKNKIYVIPLIFPSHLSMTKAIFLEKKYPKTILWRIIKA